MKPILLLLSLFSTLILFGQDKVYLRNNMVIEGKVSPHSNNGYLIHTSKNDSTFIKSGAISLIQYENGKHLVLKHEEENQKVKPKTYGAAEGWSIGTNILLPLDGTFGFGVEKMIFSNFSVRLNQAFQFNHYTYNSFYYNSSLLVNHYLGKGRVKWMSTIGINLGYSEGYYYGILYESILPQNPPYFNPIINWGIPIGGGLYLDITKHLSFTTQLVFDVEISSNYSDVYLDLFNSGFTFSYKF